MLAACQISLEVQKLEWDFREAKDFYRVTIKNSALLGQGCCQEVARMCKLATFFWRQGDGSCQILKDNGESPFATLEWEALQARMRGIFPGF